MKFLHQLRFHLVRLPITLKSIGLYFQQKQVVELESSLKKKKKKEKTRKSADSQILPNVALPLHIRQLKC